jgi:hypothetical protein
MAKPGEQRVERVISRKRLQLKALREEIEDLSDYLDVLEARAHDLGKTRLSQDAVKKRYGLKPHNLSRSRNGRKAA